MATQNHPDPEPTQPEAADDQRQPSLDEAAPVRIVGPLEIKTKATMTMIAHVISPKGVLMDLSIEGVVLDAPEGVAERAIRFETAILAKGFKAPPRLAAPAEVSRAPASAGAQAASSEATWIKGVGGAPPSCSIHGVGKWVSGTHKATRQDGSANPQAGQTFAFWGCQTRGCRPKGEPV